MKKMITKIRSNTFMKLRKKKKNVKGLIFKLLIAIIVITGILMAVVLFLSLGGLSWIVQMSTPSTSGLHHSV